MKCFLYSDDILDIVSESEEITMPLDVSQLRDNASKKIAKKEAAGLLNSSLFVQEKRVKSKGKKK